MISTITFDCDNEHCDEKITFHYIDTYAIESKLKKDGWTQDCDEHFCKKCSENNAKT